MTPEGEPCVGSLFRRFLRRHDVVSKEADRIYVFVRSSSRRVVVVVGVGAGPVVFSKWRDNTRESLEDPLCNTPVDALTTHTARCLRLPEERVHVVLTSQLKLAAFRRPPRPRVCRHQFAPSGAGAVHNSMPGRCSSDGWHHCELQAGIVQHNVPSNQAFSDLLPIASTAHRDDSRT